ncbi:MAG: FGGY family carbohydrate kinase, partial [Candidatus Eremiobacteraeota bacterium]|nr:FGGY family carbohydrate kinase [Candidatus Eremiobacteraeota bacterium]
MIIAFDQGTTSSRAIVFDARGEVVAFDQREFPQHFPQPGWVEHDPLDIWRSQLDVARGALRNASLSASDVVAIGITNQRETTILWDRATGEPVYNAIVWQDRRTAPLCEMLRARGAGELVTAQTGLLLDPYFSATKIAWLLDNVRGLRARAEAGEIAFGTVDSWLIWNLTGGARHVTDVTNASRTILFDIHRLQWSDELLALFGIPRALLPEVLPCTAEFGTTAVAHFGGEVRIAGVAGDQQAALVGQAGFAPGLAKNTYGTGSFVVLNTGDRVVRSEHGLLSTVAFAFEPGRATYALEGSV